MNLIVPFSTFENNHLNPKSKVTRFQSQGVQLRMVLVVNFFRIFEIIFFCFVVAIFDLVHDVEAIHGLC